MADNLPVERRSQTMTVGPVADVATIRERSRSMVDGALERMNDIATGESARDAVAAFRALASIAVPPPAKYDPELVQELAEAVRLEVEDPEVVERIRRRWVVALRARM